MKSYIIAFIWGLAEATFFFFIPDIYLTWLAISKPNKAIKACFIAAFGACLGGALMYAWARVDSQQALHFLTLVPGIFPKLIAEVFNNLQHPLFALFIAPFKGIPYKIYAVAFGTKSLNFFLFILVSFFARLSRFILVTLLGVMIVSLLKKILPEKSIKYLHVFIWLIIYGFYFYTMIHFYK